MLIHEFIIIFGLGPVPKHDILGFGRIRRQHPPINKGPIPDVRIRHVLGGNSQQVADQGLELVGVLDEDLHSRT